MGAWSKWGRWGLMEHFDEAPQQNPKMKATLEQANAWGQDMGN